MKIAILGAGFSGLAACWHLVKNNNCIVDIYDLEGIGGEASKIAAGLLHKYVGAHAKLNRYAIEAEQASLALLKSAELNLKSPVILSKGILRIPFSEEKIQAYLRTSSQYDDCKWLNAEDSFKITDGIVAHPGLLIKSGLTIDCVQYLQGLWLACKKAGATFIQEKIEKLSSLSNYDAIIVATGAKLWQFEELHHLKLKAVKGHLLEFEWPETLPPLKLSLNADAYITMAPDRKTCVAGSTYEKNFNDSLPDLNLAKELLLPKIFSLCPFLKYAKIVGCRAGVRAATPNHLPICGQFGEKLFVLSGMGSKGLLYHGLYAEKLCRQIVLSLLKK